MPPRPTPQQLVAELIKATGMKEPALARAIGVSQSTVNRWKRGLIAEASNKYRLLEDAHRKHVRESDLVQAVVDEIRTELASMTEEQVLDARYKIRVFLSFHKLPKPNR